MEGFILLIIIIGIINSLSKAAQAKQKKPGAPVYRSQQRMPQAAPDVRPEQPRHQPHTVQPLTHASKPSIAPTVHVTAHTDDIFEGSMRADSMEGYDPCHDDELAPVVNPCELAPGMQQPAYTGGLNLSWTGDAMVKAMVMNEILTRPCDRVRH